MLLATFALADENSADGTGACLRVDADYFEAVEPSDSGVKGYGNSRGVNINDFDGDGDLDLFVAQAVARTGTGVTYSGDDMLFIHEAGDLEFTEAGAEWGVDDGCENRSPMFGDLDNDHVPDLFVTTNGRAVLYRNRDYQHYDDVSAQAGDVSNPGWGHQGFLFDYNLDGFLDIFYTNGPEDGSGDNILLMNQADGTFRDTTEEAGVAGVPSGKGTCVLDVDVDGLPDIYVTTGVEYGDQLFMNQGDGTFRDESLERGIYDPLARFGVGATCGDLDNDGDPDILLITHDRLWSGNMLYRNDGGVFVDVGASAGIEELIDGHGSALIDVDLDGYLDIVMAGIKTPPYLFMNRGDGTFDRVCDAGGLRQDDGLTWAVAGADLTGDGYPEVYIADGLGRRPRDDEMFRNKGGSNHYLTVVATGVTHNPSALGARVEVTVGDETITRWVGQWSSFDSQGPLAVTVGLGLATTADLVRVTFTNGVQETRAAVAADQSIEIVESAQRTDIDADGVPDEWDICPQTRLGDRTDGEGCATGQRAGVGLGMVSPAEDDILAGAGTFSWQTDAESVVLQVSFGGHFGPAARIDYGPISGQSYTLSQADWQALLAESDGSKTMLWRLVGLGKDGEETITASRRFHVAVPTTVVHIPKGVNTFVPAHIVVDAGTQITWWNDSVSAGNIQNEAHDVQLADEHGAAITYMNTLEGAGFFTWTFAEPGIYSYICHRHSGMGHASDTSVESQMFHRAPGPYRCMTGSVTVR